MPESRGVDLHAHTTASDGSLSPSELVSMASSAGLAAIAVTDHDTVAALPEAAAAAESHGIELVPGIELNLAFPGRFHLLGYLFRPDDPALNARLNALQEYRASRNVRMVARMQDIGLPVTIDDVRAEAGGGLIGRPHMALTLIRKGVVSSVQEAFDRFLADGAACHVPKETVSPQEGFALIRRAGGVPVVAHPATLGMTLDELENALRGWKEAGLGGLECYYSQHSPDQEREFLQLAGRLGLVATGGSDFHGKSKPNVILGQVRGSGAVAYDVLEALKAAAD